MWASHVQLHLLWQYSYPRWKLSPLNPKSWPFREQHISAQPQKTHSFYSHWAQLHRCPQADWLTVGYVCTVQTTKNTWRYHREIWSWELEIPSDLCQDRPLYPMPTCTHKEKNSFLQRKSVHLKDIFFLEFWLIYPLEGGPFLRFSRRQNIRDAFVQPEALGWQLPVRQWRVQHGNLDLQAAKRSNMLCQRKKVAQMAHLLKNKCKP